jgi:predicted MFS family arabinose efflux permease
VALIVVGVSLVGLAHGFVNAPVVTHIADTNVARNMGAGSATALYRVLERIGHVAGPMLAGQLLVLNAQSPAAIGWAGAALIGFAILFAVSVRRSGTPDHA